MPMSLVTGLFFPVILLNQQWSPPLRLQASHCSTFRILCDVTSIAEFVANLSNVFLVPLINIIIIITTIICWIQTVYMFLENTKRLISTYCVVSPSNISYLYYP